MGIQLILPEALSEQLGLLLPSRSEPCSPYRLPSFPLPHPSVPGGQGSAGTRQLSGGEKTSHVGSLWSSRVLLDPLAPITQIRLHLQSRVRTHCPPCPTRSSLWSATPAWALVFPKHLRLALARQYSVDWMPFTPGLGSWSWEGIEGGSGSLSLVGSLLSSLSIPISKGGLCCLPYGMHGPNQGEVCAEGIPSEVSVKLPMVILVAINILEPSLTVFGPTAAEGGMDSLRIQAPGDQLPDEKELCVFF